MSTHNEMLAALVAAREFISFDRNAFADGLGGYVSADDAAELADYDAVLLQIQAAIDKATA